MQTCTIRINAETVFFTINLWCLRTSCPEMLPDGQEISRRRRMLRNKRGKVRDRSTNALCIRLLTRVQHADQISISGSNCRERAPIISIKCYRVTSAQVITLCWGVFLKTADYHFRCYTQALQHGQNPSQWNLVLTKCYIAKTLL